MTDDLLTAQELAEALGVSTDKIWRWTRENKLPHYRIPPPNGNVRRYRLSEILESGRKLASPTTEAAA